MSAATVYRFRQTWTAAEWRAIGLGPVDLLDAPGAGLTILPFYAAVIIDDGTPFTAGGQFRIAYETNTNCFPNFKETQTQLKTASGLALTATHLAQELALAADPSNKKVQLYIVSEAYLGGTKTITIEFFYVIAGE